MNDIARLAETCGTCDYFHPPEKRAPMGTCWRYPPVPASFPVPTPANAIAMPQGGASGVPGASIITFQVRAPVTAKTPCCGEWAGDDPKADPLDDRA